MQLAFFIDLLLQWSLTRSIEALASLASRFCTASSCSCFFVRSLGGAAARRLQLALEETALCLKLSIINSIAVFSRVTMSSGDSHTGFGTRFG